MNVKEKLVELLGRVQQMGVIYKENQMDERYPTIEQIRNTEVAARLIANGVTVQEWISVKDRLPDSNGQYIVTACDEGCSAGEGIWYDTVVVIAEYYDGSWTWFEGGSEYDLSGIVTHWMPLPEPPEENV